MGEVQTRTVLVLKHADRANGLDGYAFADEKHAKEWLAQPLIKGTACVAVRKVATQSKRRCGCCGGVHWWMMWRGQRVRVRVPAQPGDPLPSTPT